MTELEIILRGCTVKQPQPDYPDDWRRRLCFAMAKTMTGEWDSVFGPEPNGFKEAYASRDFKILIAIVHPYMLAIRRLTGWTDIEIENVYDEMLLTPEEGLARSVQSVTSDPEGRHDEYYEVSPRGYYALACYKIKRVAVIASLTLALGVLNLAGIIVILALL